MTYSCSDFTDSVLDVLGINVPADDNDNPSAQADLSIAEIERLQQIEKATRHAMAVCRDSRNADQLAARLAVVLNVPAPQPATSGHWAIAYHTNSTSPRARKWYYVARVVHVDGVWWELTRWTRPVVASDPGGLQGGPVTLGGNSRAAIREEALRAGLSPLAGVFTAPRERQGPQLIRIV